MIKTIYNFIFQTSNEGLVGKIQQHKGTFEMDISNIPDANKTLPIKLIKQLDKYPVPKFKGSIGIIYLSFYKNQKILIKTVTTENIKHINNEINLVKITGHVSSLINRNIKQYTKNICSSIKKEVSMINEYNNCLLLNKSNLLDKYNIKTVRISELSKKYLNKNVFIYHYDEGKPIIKIKDFDIKIKSEICKRILLYILNSLHKEHIMFNDLNISNFLYNKNDNSITIIDYGGIYKLNDKQIDHVKNLHLVQENYSDLREHLSTWNASDEVINTFWENSRIFWSKEPMRFKHLRVSFKAINLRKFNLPPCIVNIYRSFDLLTEMFIKIDPELGLYDDMKNMYT